MEFPLPLVTAIEFAMDQLLKLDDDSLNRLAPLDGKVIELHVEGIGGSIYFHCHADNIETAGYYDGEVDARISGSPLDLLSLKFNRDSLNKGNTRLSGDSHAARHFQQLLSELNIDWEGHLSQYIGGQAAYQLNQTVSKLQSWFFDSSKRMESTVGEYLNTESDLLVHDNEYRYFADQVDTLRDDQQRLEAKLQALESKNDG